MSTITAAFRPQPDITAYELALIVANTVGVSLAGCTATISEGITFSTDDWAALPAAIKRHFAVR